MIPCKWCHNIECGGDCWQEKQWAKALSFTEMYGGGPSKLAAFAKKSFPPEPKPVPYEKVQCTCVEGDDSVACLIHQDDVLKSIEKGDPCPKCGNMTWYEGWHYPNCKYHLKPGSCPVPGHPDCKAALQAKQEAPPQAKEVYMANLDGSGWKSIGYVDEFGEPVPAQKKAKFVYDTETSAVPKKDELHPLMAKKPEYKLDKKQINSYAAHHGTSRKQAWADTYGLVSAQHNAGWVNPYLGNAVPSIKQNPEQYWPDLIVPKGCKCELCAKQSLILATKVQQEKDAAMLQAFKDKLGVAAKPSAQKLSGSFKGLSKALYGTNLKTVPLAASSAPTLKAQNALYDTFLEQEEEVTAHSFATTLTPKQLFLLTGMSQTEYLYSEVVQKAAFLLDAFEQVEIDDEPKWLEEKFNKHHPNHFTLPGGVTYASADFTDVEAKVAQYYGSTIANPTHTTATANTATIPALGSETVALKPGDQVILTVDKEGQLVIPPGMNYIVVPK